MAEQTCLVCRRPIRTMAYQNTDACSQRCLERLREPALVWEHPTRVLDASGVGTLYVTNGAGP